MTDNEIIKAKEYFKYGISHDIFSEPVLSYAKTVLWAFEEINRQKAEVERLNRETVQTIDSIRKLFVDTIKAEKTEAIKEALREFNATLYSYRGVFIKGEEIMIIPMSDYDNILNEMMEDKDE